MAEGKIPCQIYFYSTISFHVELSQCCRFANFYLVDPVLIVETTKLDIYIVYQMYRGDKLEKHILNQLPFGCTCDFTISGCCFTKSFPYVIELKKRPIF